MKYEVSEEDALTLADRTARQYQLFLGLDTLPRLQLRNYYELRMLEQAQKSLLPDDFDSESGFHLPENCQFTGKIVISLQEQCVRIEAVRRKKSKNKRYIIEQPFKETEQNLQQLLERITSYGTDRNVQLLQLIDLNLLSSKGAYDEQKVSETLKERYDECMEYKRSMIVYDLDSLIGVNKSESDSNMGTSVSSSVVNQHIYVYVTSRFGEAKIEINHTDEKLRIERWAIAIVRDPFLLKKFTVDVDFTMTEEQREREEAEHRKSTDIIACVKCRDHYIESENKMGQCTYHDGFIYDNSALDLKKYRLSEALEELNRDDFLAMNDPKKKDEIERRRTRLKFICCGATVQTGGSAGGCKKGKHGLESESQTRNSSNRLSKTEIKRWEDECFENMEYNMDWTELFEKRMTSTTK